MIKYNNLKLFQDSYMKIDYYLQYFLALFYPETTKACLKKGL